MKKIPIPTVHGLLNEGLGGRILVSEYGGGTANMEFEVLTGFSPQLVEGIPYQEFASKVNNFPSYPNLLKTHGYQTLGIHPFNGNMYKRALVYPNLGIDEFIDYKTMKHTNVAEKGNYISDASAYAEALDYLKNQEQPMFINLVTMQNHQPYPQEFGEDIPFVTEKEIATENRHNLGSYFKGLSHTDTALKGFLAELKKLDRDTIVVFYGDHYPGQALFKDFYFNDEKDYETPYFIYDTSEEKFALPKITSLCYLQGKVSELAAINPTPYQQLLKDLETFKRFRNRVVSVFTKFWN